MPAIRNVIHGVEVVSLLIVTGVSVIAAAVVNAEFCFTIYGDVSWISAKLSVINLLINFLRVGFIRIEGEFKIRLVPFGEITLAFHVIGISGIRVANNFLCTFY